MHFILVFYLVTRKYYYSVVEVMSNDCVNIQTTFLCNRKTIVKFFMIEKIMNMARFFCGEINEHDKS
jgi:hypothetical protein